MVTTLAIIGAGGRGRYVYANIAKQYAAEMKIVAVATPEKETREEMKQEHGIADHALFASWEEMLENPPLADGLIIATPDRLHYEPTIAAINAGYKYILLEKPIAMELDECKEIARRAEEKQVQIQICHSLRYSPMYRKLKELLDAGTIGTVINIQHSESVGFFHYAHSYVRGNWSVQKKSAPFILAKCCHDMDLMVYLTGKNCLKLSSFGALTHFKPENAPIGAPDRCTDGCPASDCCPYYAPKLYRTGGGKNFAVLATENEGYTSLDEACEKGRYGRCVYRCGNDVCDHQVVNMLFEDGISVSFTVSAFTEHFNRNSRFMGTKGEITCNFNENLISCFDFNSGLHTDYRVATNPSGHGGADEILLRDFVKAIATKTKVLTGIRESVQSHIMAFAAEEARITNTVIEL